MYKSVGVSRLKDIESLFFEKDLLVRRKVGGDGGAGVVGNAENFFGESLGNEVGAFRFLYAVGRERGELGVVGDVVAAVGD